MQINSTLGFAGGSLVCSSIGTCDDRFSQEVSVGRVSSEAEKKNVPLKTFLTKTVDKVQLSGQQCLIGVLIMNKK